MHCLDDNVAASLAGPGPASQVGPLATCRDCRSLVAALAPAADGSDSDVVTAPRGIHGAGTDPTARALGGGNGDPSGGFAVGDRIGRYLVLGRLGAGGMGVVLSAYDPQLDRKVALKLVRTGSALGADEARARMIREAKAIAQLSHPHVVAVYDVGTAHRGDVYIAMEFVEGDTLTHWLRSFHRPWREVLDVLLQAGRGLAAAHAAGLLHRDFKPDNVLVGADGRVRVGDFGLARSLAGPDDGGVMPPTIAALHATLTATGAVLGTPRYMAPETLRGHVIDARSDQYGFCLTLYEALYGRHPIPGGSAIAVVEQGETPQPPPGDTLVPASIGRAIMRGLDDQPGKRHPSLQALLAELTPPPVGRSRRPLMVAGVAALAVGGAAAAAMVLREPPPGVVRENLELRQQLAKLERERDELIQQVKRGEAAKVEQLAEKDRQIQQLVSQIASTTPPQVAEVLMPGTAVARPQDKPTPPPSIQQRVRAAYAGAGALLAGCVTEWMDRTGQRDGALAVVITVGVDGAASSPAGFGIDDASLKVCVGDALAQRVRYPATGSTLELEVAVDIRDGVATAAPRVVRVESLGNLEPNQPGASEAAAD